MKEIKNILKYASVFFVAGIILSSCGGGGTPTPGGGEGDAEKQFLGKTSSGAYYTNTGGSTISVAPEMAYSERDHQLIAGEDGKEFAMQTDSQSIFFTLTFATKPAINQEVDLVIATKGLTKVAAGSVKAKLLKIEANKLWFWVASTKTGFIVEDIL